VFPHHENELAQSRGAGREFARIWMHNGMLELTGEKMSKSLGNIATLREVLDRWGRETILLYFLTAHWRKPIDFSDETMAQAAAQVETFRNAFRGGERPGGDLEPFEAALDDDFDTPAALAAMHEWRRAGNLGVLREALEVFGLGSVTEEESAPPEAVELARRRQDARGAGDYAEADRLRAELEAAGWEVRDEAGGFRLVRSQ
jgi:cysteinyl-tRNA synthetase